jgi:putative DNA primase/helicase
MVFTNIKLQMDSARTLGNPPSDSPHNQLPHQPLTDLGNARRLIARHGQDIRYVPERKAWIVWDGIKWRYDNDGQIVRLATETVMSFRQETYKASDPGKDNDLYRHQIHSQNLARIKAMITLASSEPGVAVHVDELDSNPFLFNLENGTLDLKIGLLRPHHPGDLITKASPVIFNPSASSEVWDSFLKTVTEDNPELIRFLQQIAGYALTGDTSEERLFFLHGPGRTGKSTFIEALRSVYGPYGQALDFETLIKRNGNGPRNDIAGLQGSRFVSSSEVDEGKEMAESLVKQMTGGDTLSVRFLYGEFFSFKPQFKLFVCANNKPRVNFQDSGLWERILQIPFVHYFAPEERDPKVKKLLTNPEVSGSAILNWALTGCLDWQANGLVIPKIVSEATAGYKSEQNPLRDFLTDSCTIDPAQTTSIRDLMNAYTNWCNSNIENYPLGQRRFKQTLESLGFKQERDASGRYWMGIGLFQ